MAVYTEKDKQILRELASRYMEQASTEENRRIRFDWVRFNAKKGARPMVIVDEIPWQEIAAEELKNHCESVFARSLETYFLRCLWMKKHLDTDAVLDEYIKMPIPIRGCDYGITAKKESGSAESNRFVDLLQDEKDIEKICFQPIEVDREAYDLYANVYDELFGGIIPVRHTGRTVLFNAWDLLETWHGVENCLIDMYDRPEFLHAIMRRITDVTHHIIDELEKLRLIEGRQESLCYSRLYCDWDNGAEEGTAKNSWTFGTAQIFSSVSKEMHEEFELPYAREIFARFGKGYYGCCEPLHDRMDMVGKIPNVEKVSISPFANARIAAENMGNRYIMSRKPTPAYLAASSVNWEIVEKEIYETLDACKANGVTVEFILKDLTTVNGCPQRLEEWSRRVSKIVKECH